MSAPAPLLVRGPIDRRQAARRDEDRMLHYAGERLQGIALELAAARDADRRSLDGPAIAPILARLDEAASAYLAAELAAGLIPQERPR